MIKIVNSSTNALPFMTKASTIWLQKLFPAPTAEKRTWVGEGGGAGAETEHKKGFDLQSQQEPKPWFINQHKLMLKLIWKKLSFQKHKRSAISEGFISPPAPCCWTQRPMRFNIHGGLSPMASESLGFNENNEGRNQIYYNADKAD